MDESTIQQMLKTVFPKRGEGTIITDAAGIISHIDCPTVRHLGYDDCTLTGSHVSAIVPQFSPDIDDEGMYTSRIVTAAGGKSIELPTTIAKLGDRRVVHINFQSMCVPNNNGDDIRNVFLSNISHEIRTPIHGIIGFADLLRATNLDRVQEHYVSTISRSASTLLHTFENILELVNVQKGAITLNNVEFAPITEFESLTQQFIFQADAKGLSVMFLIDPQLPAFLEGDIMRAKQVLSNIMSNAIKFTEQGGEIKLRIMLEKLEGEECLISFIITDNGSGIDVDLQDYVFEAFSRAKKDNTSQIGSIGSGLAISKNIVDAMGGNIIFLSEKSIGTIFLVELPFKYIKPERTAALRTAFQSLNIAFAKYDGADIIYKKLFHNVMKRLGAQYSGFSTRAEFDNLPVVPDIVFIYFNETHAAFLSEMLVNYPDVKFIVVLNRADVGLLPRISDNILEIFFLPPRSANGLTVLLKASKAEDKVLPLGDMEKIYEARMPLAVLVAEDNIISQEIVCDMLKSLGAVPTLAENGADAFEQFKKNTFDLVLMDINMPVLDGHRAARLIRDFERSENMVRTPVVAITANTVCDIETQDGVPDIDECLFKPVNKHTFYLMLRKYHSLKEHYKRGRNMSGFSYDVEKAARNIGIDSGMMLKFVGMLVETLDDDLAGIHAAVTSKNFDDMHALGHRLKGAAANLGVEDIAESCKFIETNARNKNDIDYEAAYAILESKAKLLKDWYKAKTQG